VLTLSKDTEPEPNTIYIIPSNSDAVINKGVIKLLPPAETVGSKPNINRLFNSLATSEGSRAVGIILSGTGTDGTSGLIAIKSAEGITIAQDPSTANYNGMPLTSIQAHAVDIVLPPEIIAEKLQQICEGNLGFSKQTSNPTEHVAYHQIITLAQQKTGLDLTNYKPSTISRRIHRRMKLHQLKLMQAYYDFLKNNESEIEELIQDVLIPVTEFFRDSESFDQLSQLVEKTFSEHIDDGQIRVWVPGCATGQEAYSLAIMLEKAEINMGHSLPYQIFATDLDDKSLHTARLGRYSKESLSRLPVDVVQNYFTVQGDQFQVKERIRNRITFAKHNLIKEPPFSRIHIVSCRNLLIYFNAELQKQVNDVFHYSLVNRGLLFLGISEAVSNEGLFTCLSKSARIYQKKRSARTT